MGYGGYFPLLKGRDAALSERRELIAEIARNAEQVRCPPLGHLQHPLKLYGFHSADELRHFLCIDAPAMHFRSRWRSISEILMEVKPEVLVVRDYVMEKGSDLYQSQPRYVRGSILSNIEMHWISTHYCYLFQEYQSYLYRLESILSCSGLLPHDIIPIIREEKEFILVRSWLDNLGKYAALDYNPRRYPAPPINSYTVSILQDLEISVGMLLYFKKTPFEGMFGEYR